MKKSKHSIAKQISMLFIGVMVLLLAANIAANGFLLEKYYISRFTRVLKNAYTQMNANATEDGLDEDFCNDELSRICQRNNMDLVVVDQEYTIVYGNATGTTQVMAGRLWGYNTGTDLDRAVILSETDQYTIQKKNDPMMKMDYLEMWGTLDNEYRFILRIPLQNISVNARISTEFLIYFCIVALVVSIVLILIVSGRIAKPIGELTALSKKMADLDFDAKYTGHGSSEIDELGAHFNEMSEKLEETISQLKTANNELQRDIEQKIKIDDMRKEFLSNVSHELKTPLALIQGYAEGLIDCVQDDPESRDFYCNVIVDEAGKMNVLVRKLLTLNQIEFGQEEVTMERMDLSALIENKIHSAAILSQQKNASIRYEGENDLHVWGDEFKVEEVLTNYLSNACNHVFDGGEIIVSACRCDHLVKVTVHNEGQPIPEKDIDRIWEKFYKVDKAHTREYGGSGVGLSIVKAIMDSMNREYGVYNDDTGVAFWFTLEDADANGVDKQEAKEH